MEDETYPTFTLTPTKSSIQPSDTFIPTTEHSSMNLSLPQHIREAGYNAAVNRHEIKLEERAINYSSLWKV
jgi:hypothetical protein